MARFAISMVLTGLLLSTLLSACGQSGDLYRQPAATPTASPDP